MENPSPNRRFEVLFDNAEPSLIPDEAYAPYGNFGFPPAPTDRPWIYTNFVAVARRHHYVAGEAWLRRRDLAVAR